MEISLHSGKIQIELLNAEAVFLAAILEQLKKDYQVPPDAIETKVAEVWYSNEGHLRVDASQEEERDWNQELFKYRGENAQKIEKWIELLREKKDVIIWEIPVSQIDALLVVINDYRLALAARHEVAETEMEHDLAKIEDPEKRYALLQIHLLGLMIENILDVVR